MLILPIADNQNYHHHPPQISKNSGAREDFFHLSSTPLVLFLVAAKFSLPELYPLSYIFTYALSSLLYFLSHTCCLFSMLNPMWTPLNQIFKEPSTQVLSRNSKSNMKRLFQLISMPPDWLLTSSPSCFYLFPSSSAPTPPLPFTLLSGKANHLSFCLIWTYQPTLKS